MSPRAWFVLYTVSGACGVAWQVLWVRALTPVFGAGLLAASAVTAAFLGGLGLGAWSGDQLRQHPGRTYATVEAAVALWGMAMPWMLLLGARPVVDALTGAGPTAALGVRLIAAALLVGPPAIALGVSWPAVVRALGAHPGRTARAYALNTLGAAVGALVAGLGLPWWLGITRASIAIGLVQLTLALLAWHTPVVPPSEVRSRAGKPASRLWLWLLAALTGALALTGELTWTRLASPLWAARFEGDAEAFAGVLASVLTGMGLGALAVRRAPGTPGPTLGRWLGALALTSLLLLEPVRAALLGSGDTRVLEGLLPLVPSACLGACFPLLAATLLAQGGARVGQLYAVNTAGSVVGSLATGLWLLPWLGAQRLAILLAMSAAVLAAALSPGRGRAWVLVAAAAGAALWGVPPVAGERLLLPDETLIRAVEGRLTTTLVAERPGGERLLVSGGHRIASATGSRTDDHALRAQGPASLHAMPRQVLLIGLGTGETARAFLELEGLESLQIVEIDENQPALLADFSTEAVLTDPRVHLELDDGRHWLRTHEVDFDVISVDAYGPRTASAAFYTREFFAEAAERLAPGGLVFVKFDPLSIPDKKILASYLAACFDVFEAGRLVFVAEGLFGLVGTEDPAALQVDSSRIIAAPTPRAPDARPVTDDWPVRVPVSTHPTRAYVEQWWRWQGKPMAHLPWRQLSAPR